jgi:anti-anti-sigma factor
LEQATVDSTPNNLKVETGMVGAEPVIRVQGEVTLGTAPQLRAQLLASARQTTGTVRVDLSQVSYMDSSGVGTMVYVKREIERTGRRMVLIGLQPRVRSVFELTHLDKFFTIVQADGEMGGP